MKPTELFSSLKDGPLLPLYFFHGDDQYLQELVIQHIEDRGGFGDHDALCYEVHYATVTPVAGIIDSARSLPFLGSRKFILVKEADKLPPALHKELLAYCKKPSKRTILVFSGKGKTCSFRGELLATFEEHGLIRHIPKPARTEVPLWIQHLAKERQKTINNDAVALLQDLVGNSIQELDHAVEKLSLFVGDARSIRRADVESTISHLRGESIFDLTDHIGTGRRKSALLALGRLLESGEAPLLVLYMITRHFRMLLTANTLLEQGASPEQIQKSLGIKSFILRKLLPQTTKFSRARLERCFERLWRADWALKRQRTSQKVQLERLVLDLCG